MPVLAHPGPSAPAPPGVRLEVPESWAAAPAGEALLRAAGPGTGGPVEVVVRHRAGAPEESVDAVLAEVATAAGGGRCRGRGALRRRDRRPRVARPQRVLGRRRPRRRGPPRVAGSSRPRGASRLVHVAGRVSGPRPRRRLRRAPAGARDPHRRRGRRVRAGGRVLRGSSMLVRSGSATDVGRVRDHNEDSIVAGGRVFAVADGMGGHAAGEVASRIAVEALATLEEQPPSRPEDVAEVLREANRRILRGPGRGPRAARHGHDGHGADRRRRRRARALGGLQHRRLPGLPPRRPPDAPGDPRPLRGARAARRGPARRLRGLPAPAAQRHHPRARVRPGARARRLGAGADARGSGSSCAATG